MNHRFTRAACAAAVMLTCLSGCAVIDQVSDTMAGAVGIDPRVMALRPVVFDVHDFLSGPRFREQRPEDNLELAPLAAAPAGQTYAHYMGAAASAAEMTERGRRSGAYVSPTPLPAATHFL